MVKKKTLRLEKFAEEILKIELTQSQREVLREIEKSAPAKYTHMHIHKKQLKFIFKGIDVCL